MKSKFLTKTINNKTKFLQETFFEISLHTLINALGKERAIAFYNILLHLQTVEIWPLEIIKHLEDISNEIKEYMVIQRKNMQDIQDQKLKNKTNSPRYIKNKLRQEKIQLRLEQQKILQQKEMLLIEQQMSVTSLLVDKNVRNFVEIARSR